MVDRCACELPFPQPLGTPHSALARPPAVRVLTESQHRRTARIAAFQALFLIAEMQPGARVLIHAGASGVGIAANQLARGFGASEVFTTAGSKAKCDFLKNTIGVDHAINYKEQDFAEEVRTSASSHSSRLPHFR